MKSAIHPRFVPTPYQDAPDSGRLILRDGTTAQLRVASPADLNDMRVFFERLTPESRQRRFFSFALPQPQQFASLCDNSDPRSVLTLVVTRFRDGQSCIIATASYLSKSERT